MTLKALILSGNGKKAWEEVAQRAIRSEADLKLLMSYFECDDEKLAIRATQCVGKLHDRNRMILTPYLAQMIQGLGENKIDAYKRNVMRIFQTAQIPEAYEGHLFDYAFTFLEDKTEPIAVKAFSMTVCRRIAQNHKDLAPEVIGAIELVLEENDSAGVINRAKKEIKRLEKLLEG